MTKQKSTKRALLASVLSLVLCISMLVGSTFAWFTDSATTGVNKILSGNLDIVLEYLKDDGTWAEADANTKLFDEAALWEPGYTEVVYLKIKNAGSLALSYRMAINIANEKSGINMDGNPFNLSDYIEFGVVESDDEIAAYADRAAAQAAVAGNTTKLQTYAKEANLLPDEDAYVALVVCMPTTVGNEANYMTGTTPPSVELGVNVFATQMSSENDSFGSDYDASAFVQEPIVFDADATYTTSYIKANGSNGVLQATNGATLTINSSGTVNAEMADDGYAMAVWANGGNVVIEGGNFEQSETGTETQYDMIYASNGGNITIKGGTFKSVTPQWTLNVKDADRATSHITVMGGKFYQFDPSNAQTGEGEISVHEDYKVVQNGDWYEVVEKMEYTTIDSIADFVDFANAVTDNTLYKGYQVANNNYITASLTTDIDLTDVTGPAANANQFAIGNGSNTHFDGTFDGQGHTISNLTITGNWTYYRGLFRTVSGKFTMKNVVFDTVENISGVGVGTTKTRNIGVVVGAVGGGEVTFENVTIKNAHVEGSYNTGLLFGRATAGEVNVINCKLENSVIETKYHVDEDGIWAGALFTSVDTTYGGCIGTISGNTVSNVTWKVVDSESETSMKDATSDLIGYRVDDVAYDINGNAK